MSEISEIPEKLFRVFSEFSILPYSENLKLGFKNLGKNFRDFQDFRGFRVFDLTKKNLNQCKSMNLQFCKMTCLQRKIQRKCMQINWKTVPPCQDEI